jgi:trehalose 6-phosphate phosphatase
LSRPIIQGPADVASPTHDAASATAQLEYWLGERWQVCALFLDVDGTLLDIAASPEAVFVPAELRTALEILHRRLGGALALISGRTVADLDRIFAPVRLPACGGHGVQWRLHAQEPLRGEVAPRLAASLLKRLHSLAAIHSGIRVEDKGSSVALHYSGLPTAGQALAYALGELLREPEAAGLRLLPGKMVFEVIAHACDKAQAIRRMLEVPPFAGRRPLFIGDDVTDEPALAMMANLGGLALSVGCLHPGASAAFADPAAVRAALISAAGEVLQ